MVVRVLGFAATLHGVVASANGGNYIASAEFTGAEKDPEVLHSLTPIQKHVRVTGSGTGDQPRNSSFLTTDRKLKNLDNLDTKLSEILNTKKIFPEKKSDGARNKGGLTFDETTKVRTMYPGGDHFTYRKTKTEANHKLPFYRAASKPAPYVTAYTASEYVSPFAGGNEKGSVVGERRTDYTAGGNDAYGAGGSRSHPGQF